MSEINFLGEDDSGKKVEKVKKDRDPGIEYSKPRDFEAEPGDEGRTRGGAGPAAAKSPKDSKNLREKRKEVLKSIRGKEGKPAGQKSAEIISSKKDIIFSLKQKLKNLFAKKNQTENNKELLAESGEIYKENQEARKNFFGADASAGKQPDASGAEEKNSDKWADAKVIKTNLIQDEVTVFVDWGKYAKLSLEYFIVISVFVISGYIGLYFWEIQVSSRKEVMSADIENKKMQIIALNKEIKEIQGFQKELILAAALLDKHIYWTNFFEFLEDNTLTNVYFNGGFSGNTQGKYNFPANADSYKAITDQIAVLRSNKNVIGVQVNSGQMKQGKNIDQDLSGQVNFSLELTLDPKIFFTE